ncbi:bifunctional diaminohydroxyphosphoribosylaminopyrimidine deaminase/5-amino-6-(5-phosphoribosylamino)uracil reductase RibD [Parasphingorhabdus halotolerans]|uniref:Riboflavin biosynthesis protein RibD n=1 Tax=Parasphingorhabdus halotolerans TaxID=2725558 RepID=A0A6H2DNL5_9SPHN|nr:bifunctional diaminohydroxyphosphoribosylaminopyrimidine deaminase/5-amino-6-(5-phosphoribosylamino)uracil reductase RibD [Parasphingorhabdus halotolerans]QJB69727.1 bifunctional diaminohydroxyphosphoribosylaminopyrimidine deaminase/5-amino-6-(5-phosphoribosylamino)uracil reductase RibD [Parasphingorhabdus halotolerans]
MAAAIALTHRGRGRTGANPNVGCVVVKNGIIISRGWTQPGGRPHAEEMALAAAGAQANGADIYVTLEPCVHESARGPACCNAVIKAKPARVIVASLDADKRTHRRGIDALGKAGIAVEVGVLEEQARRAMAGFFMRMEKGRPFVTLKLAMSLDGCIAMADGKSKWITGERARMHGHLERATSDAILVGSGTVLADNPALDVRIDGLEDRSPITVMLGESEAPENWHRIPVPTAIADLEGVNWLMVEGGATTAASFLEANLVDRLLLYRAPIIIGGGLPSIRDIGLSDLASAHGNWRRTDRREFAQDVLEIYERAA